MFSAIPCSTSISTWSTDLLLLPPGPVPARISRLAETIRTLDATGDQSSTEGRDDLIEELYFAVVRWKERPEIVMLLEGLPLPLTTDEHVREARRRLPYIVDAINDAEVAAQEQASQLTSVARHRAEAGDRINPTELAALHRMNVAMAAASYGYRGPENRGHSVAAIASAAAQLDLTLDEKTIRKHLDAGAKQVKEGSWPED